MTDQPPPDQPLQPEVVGGLPLAQDAALIPRQPQLNLPALHGGEDSWGLIAHAATLARMVAGTEFVPEKFRNRPAAVAGTMLLGHELGLGPMASLRGMHVTKEGDILMAAQTLRALIRRAGHRIWPGEHTSTRCTWHGERRDDPDHQYEVTWTIDDAKQAKLIRDGSAWTKTPRAMLSARASSELCRMLGEDALAGVAFYTQEEANDGVETVRDVSAEVAGGEAPPGSEPDPNAPETAPGTQRRSRRQPTTATTAPQAPTPPASSETTPTPTPPQAAAVMAVTRAPGPDLSIAIPGDDPPPAAAAPVVERSEVERRLFPNVTIAGEIESPLVNVPITQQMADDLNLEAPEPVKIAPPDYAQRLAIACREADLARGEVVAAISKGRTASARELTEQEAVLAIGHVRYVTQGTERLTRHAGGPPTFEPVPTDELTDTLRNEFAALIQRDRPRAAHILHESGWTDASGPVSMWFGQQERGKVLSLIAMTRAAVNPTQEEMP